MKEYSDLLSEKNKKQEVVFIKDTNLKENDVLLFEEGILPRKGVINMQIYLWKGNKFISSVSNDDINKNKEAVVNDETQAVVTEQKPPSSPSRKNGESKSNHSSPSRDNKETNEEFQRLEQQFEEIQLLKENSLILIGEINFPLSVEVKDLYDCISHLLTIKKEKLSSLLTNYEEPKDINHLLLKEFRHDIYLPGKPFWLSSSVSSTSSSSSSTTAVSSSISASSTGNLNRKGASKTSNSDSAAAAAASSQNNILKKLGIKSDSKSLVIEILSSPQQQVKSIQYSSQVWVQRLLNPNNCDKVSPFCVKSWLFLPFFFSSLLFSPVVCLVSCLVAFSFFLFRVKLCFHLDGLPFLSLSMVELNLR
jgi:hypothetical protein